MSKRSRFTREDLRDVLMLRSAGWSWRRIERDTGIDHSTAYLLVSEARAGRLPPWARPAVAELSPIGEMYIRARITQRRRGTKADQ